MHTGGVSPLATVALHLGDLHPYEQTLVLLLAFGPFVLLAAVVYVVRRRDSAAERADLDEGDVNG